MEVLCIYGIINYNRICSFKDGISHMIDLNKILSYLKIEFGFFSRYFKIVGMGMSNNFFNIFH